MLDFFYSYQLLLDAGMITAVLALSQFVVLKAGVFSIAPVGIQAIAAYTTAILQVKSGVGPWPSLVAGVAIGLGVSLLLALPLARLRGVFQAIATLSFVIVVQSMVLVFDGLTGGPNGINGIPQSLGTASLAGILLACVALLLVVNRSKVGRAFDALRQDEVAAASHGVSVVRYHMYAFGLSGLLAGVSGAMTANYTFSVVPEAFGFQSVVNTLTYVVVGGVVMVGGPLFGSAFLLMLPELIRSLADQRLIVNGLLLLLTVTFLPSGVVDGIADRLRSARGRSSEPPPDEGLPGPAEAPPPDREEAVVGPERSR